VFEAFAGPAQPVNAAAQANPGPAPQSVIILAATGLDDAVFRHVQANVRKRIVRPFVVCGHVEPGDVTPARAGRAPAHKSSQCSGFGPTMPPGWRLCWQAEIGI